MKLNPALFKNAFFRVIITLFLFISNSIVSQNKTLDYFLSKAEENAVALKENNNLLKIGELQNTIIKSQNTGFKVDATSEVLFAPYFNSNGKAIEITTNPSSNAYGYDVGITNGGLYAAQLNVTKNLFNKASTDNLLFQNIIKNKAITLSSEDDLHNIKKNVIDSYILVYQYQLLASFTKDLKTDLEKKLQVVEILVKRGVLLESDYLVLKLDIDNKNLELQQTEANFKNLYAQLYNLCGIPIGNIENLEIPHIEINSQQNLFFYQKKFENDSLQIVADQKVFENQYKPQITAYGNTGLNAIEFANIPQNFGFSSGLKLSIPIYDGNQKKYNGLQNQIKQETLEYYKQNNEVLTKNNLKSIEQQITSLEQNKILTENQIIQQKNLMEIYKGKLIQGQVSIIDFLNLVQNYKITVYTKLQMQTNLWLLYNAYNYTNW